MITEVRLPEISENVESGDVIKLLVSVGDLVDVDQPLLELETDKAVLEVPSPHRGKVIEILVKTGETVRIGQVILKIDTSDAGSAPETPAREEPSVAAPVGAEPPSAKTHAATEIEKSTAPSERPKETAAPPSETAPDTREGPQPPAPREEELPPASPAVRRLARELGVDLRGIEGSGPRGRILQEDVNRSARDAAEKTVPRGETRGGAEDGDADRWGPIVRKPMSKVRKVTARTMGHAWTTIPHVTHYDKADITGLDAMRGKYGGKVEKAGGKLTITAVLIKVASSALKVFPQFNASIDADTEEIVYKNYYHIGVAVDTDRGLIVPVIRDADRKNITELSVELAAIAEKTRTKKITPDELEGGTFTVSNLGGIGGTGFSPIVYPPQVAILGAARARIEPVFREGEFEPRLILPLSVSYDHRLIDGADGARFLRWIAQALEEPILLALEG